MSNGLRREGRTDSKGKVRLTWVDEQGNPFTSRGECIDVSTNGLRIIVTARIAQGTVVQVEAKDLKVHGSACVRSCQREKLDYILGMEFVGGFQWNPNAAAPRCYD